MITIPGVSLCQMKKRDPEQLSCDNKGILRTIKIIQILSLQVVDQLTGVKIKMNHAEL